LGDWFEDHFTGLLEYYMFIKGVGTLHGDTYWSESDSFIEWSSACALGGINFIGLFNLRVSGWDFCASRGEMRCESSSFGWFHFNYDNYYNYDKIYKETSLI